MPGVVILGGQWGDEGKGKIIDYLAQRADVVARFQGGDNAGHTVVVEGKQYVFHLIPSGIVLPGKTCIIGHGVVVNPFSLMEEKASLEKSGCQIEGRLWVSDRAHLILPYHKTVDALREAGLGSKKIGTTGRGVGPAYGDKVARIGIRMGDLLNVDYLAERLRQNAAIKNKELQQLGADSLIDPDKLLEELRPCIREISPLIKDTIELLHGELRKGKTVLWEGAQGALLDVDLGTYPYVTSSNTAVGGALTGTGVGPRHIQSVVAVVKAYATRVGGGPFPTQCAEEEDRIIREKGHEYGATTGRPRRCGWFDVVAARYSVQVSGVDHLAITKLDVLDDIESIRICEQYKLNGRLSSQFPSDIRSVESCEPVYTEIKGWCQKTIGVTRYEDLPTRAKSYLETIEKVVGVPISLVSTGPDRRDIIEKVNPFA